MNKILISLASASMLAIASVSADHIREQWVSLTPENEPHMVDLSGPFGDFNPSGLAYLYLDTTANFLYYEVEWSGLTGPSWGLHFHEADEPGGTGPIALSIFNTLPDDLPDAFGDNPAFGFIASSASVSEDFITAFDEGRLYLNLHTLQNGPGEIRGNIMGDAMAIPEPSILGLLPLGLLVLGLRIARHQR